MYVIIETRFGCEYKIGIPSYRFTGPQMYILLADTYYLGEVKDNSDLKKNRARTNRFMSYEEAEHAVKELSSSNVEIPL